ncbi:MAG: sensor histidine kinase [Bacteroidales bacterium]
MVHPVFESGKYILYYFIAWLLPAGIHFVSLLLILDAPAGVAAVDTLFSVLIYAALGFGLWFLTFSVEIDKTGFLKFLLSHFLALLLVLFIWISLSEAISYLVLGKELLIDNAEIRLYKILEGSLFYLILIVIYYLLSYYKELKDKELNQEKLARNLRESELKVLKSQMNPHFLFNSLNSVASLTMSDAEKARDVVIRLSDYMRYSLKTSPEDLIDLGNEINNCKRYLEIEQARFGEKMKFVFDVPEACKNIKLPVLCLQAFYENAVKHGVYESDEQIIITTEVSCDDSFLHVKIVNNYAPEAPERKGEGIGLSGIKKRLKLIYDSQGLLHYQKTGNNFIVELDIPKKP